MTKPIPESQRAGVLAQRLRDLRELSGLTQQDVANHLCLTSRASVSQLEGGVRGVKALELLDLARLYKVPLTRLTEGL